MPILVTLCVTNRCNLKCFYCYEEYYDRNHREFTTEEIFRLIDELVQMGTKYISIGGGEALLRKDIGQIVDRIKQRNILCHLSTNGLIVKDHVPVLKKVDSLAISIDGRLESNDLNRGKGTFRKLIEAFEILNKEKIQFHSHTVLTRNNSNAVEELMVLARAYHFQAQFSPLRVEDSPDKSLGLDDIQLKKMIQKILKLKKQGAPVFFSAKTYENFLNWPFPASKQFVFNESIKGYKPIKCYIKNFACHIEANGLVYPCIVLVNKFKALNLLEVGFQKAWENLAENGCRACNNICCNDLNLIFGFNPDSIWNALKIVVGRLTDKSSAPSLK